MALRHVEYVDGSSAGQYIDTGLRPNVGTDSIEMDVQALGVISCLYGARNGSNAAAFAAFAYDETKYRFDRASSKTEVMSATTVRKTVRMEPTKLTAGDVVQTVSAVSGSPPVNVYLTSVNTNGKADERSQVRVYGCRMWSGGTLVRDYVPYTQDGVAGFYDRVNGTFQGSQSGNPYTAGPPYWNVELDQVQGATLSASASEVLDGGSVVITATPDDGKLITGLTVNGTPYDVAEGGGQVTISDVSSDLTATVSVKDAVPPITGLSLAITVQPNPVDAGATYMIRAEPKVVTSRYYVLPASTWAGTGPYEQTLAVEDSTIPGQEALVYGDHTMTVEQRAAEYNAVLRASVPAVGRITFRALSIKPKMDLPVRVIDGLFPKMMAVDVPATAWQGSGPWTASVDIGSSVQSAVVGAVSGSSDAQVTDMTDAGIHVSAVNGQTVTLRAMLAKPTVDLKVGVLAI